MFWSIRFVQWLKWLKDGKPVINYLGHHCGCCGAWTDEEYAVPMYRSAGEWWDTWGLCPICRGDLDGPDTTISV